MEDEKYQNLMRWLIYSILSQQETENELVLDIRLEL